MALPWTREVWDIKIKSIARLIFLFIATLLISTGCFVEEGCGRHHEEYGEHGEHHGDHDGDYDEHHGEHPEHHEDNEGYGGYH